MKGSTAKAILRSLTGKRLDGFLGLLAEEAQGELLIKICKFILSASELTDVDTMAKLSLTRGQYAHWMEKIGHLLTNYVVGAGGLVALGQAFEIAKFLSRSKEREAATDLIRSGIRAALEIEDFELVLRILRLRELVGEVETEDIISEAYLFSLKDNLAAFERLFSDFEYAAREKVISIRRERIHSILNSNLLATREHALSNRSAYYYYKLRLNCLVHLGEYDLAIAEVEHLLDLVRSKPWVHDDAEFVEAKCLSILAYILRLTNQLSRFDQVSKELETQQYSSKAATEVQLFLRFPASIAIAIQRGDGSALQKASQDFLDLLEKKASEFSPQYVTENLCQIFYGAFATQNNELWTSLSRTLGSYRKVEFKPQYYTFCRFLFLAKAVEEADWDECKRLIKNLRVGTTLDCFNGLRKAIDFLSGFVAKWDQLGEFDPSLLDTEAKARLDQLCEDLEFSQYFDFHSWMLSLERGCSLMEAIRERASP